MITRIKSEEGLLTKAVQNAINSANDGDTIFFSKENTFYLLCF